MELTTEEKEQLRREKIEYDHQEDLYTAEDEFIRENLKDLMQEFCEDNDDFKAFCREQYNIWGD